MSCIFAVHANTSLQELGMGWISAPSRQLMYIHDLGCVSLFVLLGFTTTE